MSVVTLRSESVEAAVQGPPKKLIGLAGKAGVGKDTVGEILWHMGFDRYALAGPLKAGVRAMFGLHREYTDGALKEEPILSLGGITPRRLMQTLGTEWARNTIHPDVWLWLAEERWKEVQEFEGVTLKGLVITDIRFDNEADFVRSQGGEVWHVIRPILQPRKSFSGHSSEGGVKREPQDKVVVNGSTIQSLTEAVKRMASC